ncbi:MAG: LCP family protein [Actinomycetota bacterium]
MNNPFRKRSDPDRYSGMVRSVRLRERRHMRHRWQWIALAVSLILLLLAGSAFWLYRSILGEIQRHVGGVEEPKREGAPFNALLVGSDSRAGLSDKEKLDLGAGDEGIFGERADTLIVAHVDPATNRVTMVQFPRDLWVPIPGEGKDRVNSALVGGKSKLVATVEGLSGIGINHYVQVNIAGFRDLVDAIDGVDVCVPEPIQFDPNTGIEVKEPGLIHFGGDRAVRFVRSRKAFGEGDLARVQNQQKFLSAAIDKITSVGTLIDPGRIRGLINAAGKNLRIDDGTSPTDLYRIGQRLREFDPEHYEAYTVPNLGPSIVDGKSVLLPDAPAMKVMFRAIVDNESPADADGMPDIEPATIRVGVLNGTSVEGAARAAARDLERATDVGDGPVAINDDNIANANRFGHKRTVIRFSRDDPGARKMASLVAAAVPDAAIVEGRTDLDVDVEVVVGGRFKTRRLIRIEPIPIPKPGALPQVCRG